MSPRTDGASVREIGKPEMAEVARMLARAFWDDPLTSHLLRDEKTRPEKLPRMFAVLMKLGMKHRSCFVTSGHEAATLWRPPGKWHMQLWDYVANGPELLSVFGPTALGVMATMDKVEKVHPKEPHWYLQVIGTDPDKQGKGFASLILREQLKVADAARMPCYLESSKATNVPIYRNFGFDVTREIKVPGGGPTLWAMWRPVQA